MMTAIQKMKAEAAQLRADLAAVGEAISHSAALERLAREAGFRDWNTASAALKEAPNADRREDAPPISIGQSVKGAYLGQPFTGRVLSLSVTEGDRFRIALDLDQPVDAVTFESFSSWRKRITGTIGRDGRTVERISTGAPQLCLTL